MAELLEKHVLPKLSEPIRCSPVLDANLKDLIQSVKAQCLEGLVTKKRDSHYGPGQRSDAWQKMRVNQRREFVIGGYTPAPRNFDALAIGYYDGDRLMYAARTRNGFTPASRAELFRKLKPLETAECPFCEPARKEGGPLGRGADGGEKGECRWLPPQLVGQLSSWSGPRTRTCGTARLWGCGRTKSRGM